ncbi:hypothetical protein [Hymenobacter weizhouensis]|uniref:hypothetical protein n=1 Tax=Hymenobacter sp. YIM 151500-1 TaxID=2987689 RepID=UPI002225C889|nr:hypothetical protein [Hymenobacter sp. YIM 151500-1]UYZ61564.1 hypothetical protein OIS53_11155 [Hymenobacter sp. YIM 151500-1]
MGLLLHRDYGVSADEPNNHLNGLVSAKYLAQLVKPDLVAQQPNQHLIPDIRRFRDADHGVAFELPAAALSYVLTRHDSQAFYYLRHLLTFLVFVLGVGALYRLAALRFGHWGWGLLAAGLLVLSPRFFAEAFYNSKDSIYMALFTVAIYTLVRLLDQPTPGRAVWHGVATALAVDLRVQGLLLLLLTVVMLSLEVATRPSGEAPRRRVVRVGLLYVATALACTYIGWPYLWAMSWTDLLTASQRLNRFPWAGVVLYWGHVYHIPAERLPWHYIPGWILVTTPVAYTLAAMGGLVLTLRALWRPRAEGAPPVAQRCDVLVVLWLLVPLLLLVGLNMTVYNGWRHLYFIYPAVLMLTVRGVHFLWTRAHRHSTSWALAARLLLVAGGLEAAYTAGRMVEAHPNQHVFFSFLPPSAAERLFELDYWGLSYRQGLEWVLAHDASPHVVLTGNPGYIDNNMLVLPPEQRARIRYVYRPTPTTLPAEARYYLTAYHYYNGRPQQYPDSTSLGGEVYTIRANGLRIFSVFKRW